MMKNNLPRHLNQTVPTTSACTSDADWDLNVFLPQKSRDSGRGQEQGYGRKKTHLYRIFNCEFRYARSSTLKLARTRDLEEILDSAAPHRAVNYHSGTENFMSH